VRAAISLYVFFVGVIISGCSKPDVVSFVASNKTQDLVPFVQERIKSELQSKFGSPSALVAWERLPVDFGTYSGRVADNTTIVLEPKSKLAWHSRVGSIRGASVSILGTSNEVPLFYTSTNTGEFSVVDSTGALSKVALSSELSVTGDTLQFGRELYLRHCMHCHGLSGDGNGPTAKYFAVRPRDYRRGTFKFTSTKKGIGPSRDDLFRIVKLGVPGTYMPSFMLLPDAEVSALVEYVRWLSLRGQYEAYLCSNYEVDFGKNVAAELQNSELASRVAAYEKEELRELISNFSNEARDRSLASESEESVLVPSTVRIEPSPESIARGRALFADPKKNAKCYNCHGELGRGDGPSTEVMNDVPGKPGQKALGLFDEWGNAIRPRDLTSGIFRGGRRPIDIFRRISAGIKGTPMQAFGAPTLSDDEIWDLTNYVLSIPFSDKGHRRASY